MTNEGTKTRARFATAMEVIAVGAKLQRRATWTVMHQARRETSMGLVLQCGRRSVEINVPICHSGPVLWEVGLRPAAYAPVQRELLHDHPPFGD